MGALGLAGQLFGGLVEPGLGIRAGRCLRASASGCRQCVDICPADALRLGPRGSTQAPQSELSRCTDCGLCMASCPSAAITGVGVPAGVLTREAERLSSGMRVSCAPARRERTGSNEDLGLRVSCLAALSRETVVATALALQPGSTLTLTRADCLQCPTAQRSRAETVVRESRDLLRRLDGGSRSIGLETISPTATDCQPSVTATDCQPSVTATDCQPSVEPHPRRARRRDWSRRDLFTFGSSRGRAAPPEAVTSARAELLSHSADPSLVPMQLTHPVDARGCTFCGACAAVCPTRALLLTRLAADGREPDDGRARLALTVDPGRCVGCGRCEQVCVDSLLTLGSSPRPTSPERGVAGRPVILARGERSSCDTCRQLLTPGEQGVCSRCVSARTLVADVLARQR